MSESLAAQVKALKKLTLKELKIEWQKVFGTPSPKHRRRVSLILRLTEKLRSDQEPKLFPEYEAKVEETGTRIRNTSTDG